MMTPKAKPFKCPRCKRWFKTELAMNRHRLDKHWEPKP